MPENEIPKTEWPEFLERFTRRHRGWLVTVEESGPFTAPRVTEPLAPLAAIDTTAPTFGEVRISLLLGDRSHVIREPTYLGVDLSPDGIERGLRITSASGASTLVRFRSPMAPERVDALGGTYGT